MYVINIKSPELIGPERKNAVITQQNKELIAYHEGGHALVAIYTKGK